MRVSSRPFGGNTILSTKDRFKTSIEKYRSIIFPYFQSKIKRYDTSSVGEALPLVFQDSINHSWM